jgi:6-pyruvoyltetrahydropterin/6-carboxytetrahydropterin synthase
MSKFYSTKTYPTDKGLSCCFRQWRATHSHCSMLHGYSIGIRLVFECEHLDERNWVYDFGGLDQFKRWAEYMFDHTMLIAEDDPHLSLFEQMAEIGYINMPETTAVCDLRVVPGVGCEKFAEMCYNRMAQIIEQQRRDEKLLNLTVRVKSAEVFEHGANSAIYEG